MTLEELLKTYPTLVDYANILVHAGFDEDVDTFKVVAYLIKEGKLDAVASLIEAGYDVNSAETGDFGSSLLHNAIRYDQMEIFNYLIDQGANIDFVDTVGWTPLMEAIIDSRPDFGKVLVEKNCDQTLKNKRGVDAKMLAMKFGKEDFLAFLN